MTDYENFAQKQLLDFGQLVIEVGGSGQNLDVNFNFAQPNTSYQVQLSLLNPNVEASSGFVQWVSTKGTSDMTCQVREFTSDTGFKESITDGATLFWEVWR